MRKLNYVVGGILAVVASWWLLRPAAATEIVVYKKACGCCLKWVEHLRANGFTVDVKDVTNLDAIKAEHGVRPGFAACHTAIAEGYVVEGHVPANDIRRLLTERPAVTGIAVPGMPAGSPGMEGASSQPYNVLTFDGQGNTAVYERH